MEASIKGAKVVEVLRGRSEPPRRLDKASLLMEAISLTYPRMAVLKGSLRVVESRSAVLYDSNSVSTSRTTAASLRLPSGTCLFTIMAESEKGN